MNYLLKSFWGSLAMLALLILISPAVHASEEIFDQANLFSDSQKTDISEKIAVFKQNTGMDGIVVTTNDAGGKTAKDYADDFYDERQFGVGTDRSGFLFLIDMDNRTYHISTNGKMKELLTESRTKKMLDNAEEDMINGDYHLAALSILDDAIKYSDRYQYDSATGDFKRVRKLTPVKTVIAVVGAIVASIASYSSVYGTYNLKRSTYKYSYREKGNLKLSQKEDQLIDTFTTTRHIPKPTNTGGGGGGGGGGGHGGGGRSF
ncbi:TPM domain-containing protein [uncultured Vagococcus sp.]|uniref:TPM domain-containing protein n=1 Tax=uncultured Vagococcus sp. TaxID=189676 RepID=UPI0028D713A2|nr:TPM domain-containing protein [uncultured Vagococcus sp.]